MSNGKRSQITIIKHIIYFPEIRKQREACRTATDCSCSSTDTWPHIFGRFNNERAFSRCISIKRNVPFSIHLHTTQYVENMFINRFSVIGGIDQVHFIPWLCSILTPVLLLFKKPD